MKNITILFSILFYVFLFSGCGGSSKGGNTGGNVVVTPQKPINPATVSLRAENKGNVSYINMNVVPPAGTKKNLLDYNGPAKVTGTIQTLPAIPCLANRSTFSCNAQLSAGSIQINNCNIRGHGVSLTIVLFRGQEIKTTYKVLNIIINADQACYFNK